MAKKRPSEARTTRDDVVEGLRHIAEEIRPLTDATQELTILLQHVWQNREELVSLLEGLDKPKESDAPLAAAEEAGQDGSLDGVEGGTGTGRAVAPPRRQ